MINNHNNKIENIKVEETVVFYVSKKEMPLLVINIT